MRLPYLPIFAPKYGGFCQVTNFAAKHNIAAAESLFGTFHDVVFRHNLKFNFLTVMVVHAAVYIKLEPILRPYSLEIPVLLLSLPLIITTAAAINRYKHN